MTLLLRYLFVLSLALAMLQSCKHHPIFEPIDPSDTITSPVDTTGNPNDTTGNDTTGTNTGFPCHPDTVYFVNDIQPILNTYCAMPGLGCHDIPTDDNDEVVLTSYWGVINTADVDAFDPGGSKLYKMITETDPDKHMPPPGYAQLSPQQIQMIYAWIMQGALNNQCNPNYGNCDTTNLTYALDIQPLINNKCVGCHNSTVASDGINLSTLQGVKNAQFDNGRLKGSVNHLPGYAPMPYNQPKLSDCDVKRINAWINAGMP